MDHDGKGPLDLALNVCEWYLLHIGYQGPRREERQWSPSEKGDYFQLSIDIHEQFWHDFIAKVPREGITIPFAVLKEWFDHQV